MKPGGPPSWGPGRKSAAATAIGDASCVWFTMAAGRLTETYYPRPDIANTRALFFAVTGPAGFFSDERSDTVHTIRMSQPGIPFFESENRCRNNRYILSKSTFTDPSRNVLLQRVRLTPSSSSLDEPLKLWVFLEPALENRAYGNNAWFDPDSGALVVSNGSAALALMASCGFFAAACSYQGPQDAWHQLKAGNGLKGRDRAEDGNIVAAAHVILADSTGTSVLALGFGKSPGEAVKAASDSLSQDVEQLASKYVEGWRDYRRKRENLAGVSTGQVYESSIAVLKSHQSKKPCGGMVASLAIPWGDTEQQALDFRYQMAWTRDAVQSASAFIAIGDSDSARAAWHFLVSTQDADGHWPQNMWLDGSPHWNGIQMDETGMPILLADLLRRTDLLSPDDVWPTVRRAAAYLIQNGPGTGEDRWEDAGGFSPYTLAIEIAALLAAAEIGETAGEKSIADYLRAVADWWNDNVEHWTYLDNHYVRLSTPQKDRAGQLQKTTIKEKGHAHSPASLALVRFGLRPADDPRIVKTVADIDRHLRSETATGTTWHRYVEDHYGEYDDGRPFDGIGGAGRGWPLLAAERAHYEIARGNFEEARRLASVIEKQTNECGFLPEQIWDREDLPARHLFNGRPSGSAMPLVWAHAEYIKLLRSLRDGTVFDMPPQPLERYQKNGMKSAYAVWRHKQELSSLPPGKTLRIESRKHATVYWTFDHWQTTHTESMKDSGVGLYYCDLPTSGERAGLVAGFTFYWDDGTWENRAYELPITA